jgi:hypothetical protein
MPRIGDNKRPEEEASAACPRAITNLPAAESSDWSAVGAMVGGSCSAAADGGPGGKRPCRAKTPPPPFGRSVSRDGFSQTGNRAGAGAASLPAAVAAVVVIDKQRSDVVNHDHNYQQKRRPTTTELYTNESNVGQYCYARDYECDRDYGLQTLAQEMGSGAGGAGQVSLFVSGVPDGVPPQANMAIVPKGTPRRLHYFSDVQLSEGALAALDGHYGLKPYPRMMVFGESAIFRLPPGKYPRCNFYACIGPPASNSRFVEYRYLQSRYTPSQVCVDLESMTVCRLGPMTRSIPIIIVMPQNFVRTSPRAGFFHFERLNLVVRVYSRYTLTCVDYRPDPGTISDVSGRVDALRPLMEAFFSRLGLHRISSSDEQICAHDRMLVMVVGSVANVTIPPSERAAAAAAAFPMVCG